MFKLSDMQWLKTQKTIIIMFYNKIQQHHKIN